MDRPSNGSIPHTNTQLVEEYDAKVVECIQYLCDCEELSREEKHSFFKKARRALGQTALMLSGGGAIAMYHAGVIRALIHTGLYKCVRAAVHPLPRVRACVRHGDGDDVSIQQTHLTHHPPTTQYPTPPGTSASSAAPPAGPSSRGCSPCTPRRS